MPRPNVTLSHAALLGLASAGLVSLGLGGFLSAQTSSPAQDANGPLGLWQGQAAVGSLLKGGAAEYDSSTRTYKLRGSGENMWFAQDDFEFAWKQVSDDTLSLEAGIALLGTGGDNHRKAILMIRQSLSPDAAYVDAAVHGDGLTSLQFRETNGAVTHEIESNAKSPRRLRIQKQGDRFYLFVGDGTAAFAGGSTRVELKTPFYVGLGVCAHNKDAVQEAAFSNVTLQTGAAAVSGPAASYSTVETIAVASTDARVAYVAPKPLANPFWSADGQSVLFQSGSATQSVPFLGATTATSSQAAPPAASTEAMLSPDGKLKATLTPGSADSSAGSDMVLSVVTVATGANKVLAKLQGGPGTLSSHPWSPDGKRLTFVSYQKLGSGARR